MRNISVPLFLLVSAVTEVIFSIVFAMMLCFGFRRKKTLIACSIWCTDSDVNDPNHLLQVLTSLIYLHKFSFSSFPIQPYNFPIHLYMSTKRSTNTLKLFMQALIQSEPWAVPSSSGGVLGSHAVYLAPQLLLCTVLLVFPQRCFFMDYVINHIWLIGWLRFFWNKSPTISLFTPMYTKYNLGSFTNSRISLWVLFLIFLLKLQTTRDSP